MKRLNISLKFKKAGFTLVEILIVIMIMGVLGGMGALSVRRMLPRMRADQASSRLAFQLQLARSEAIALNQMSLVSMNLDSNEFVSWIDNNRNGSRDAEEVTTVELASPALVKIQSDWTSGIFNAFGQFILTPGQREIKTVTTRFIPDNSTITSELIIRGSGAITKR